jgi:hypothetical protein
VRPLAAKGLEMAIFLLLVQAPTDEPALGHPAQIPREKRAVTGKEPSSVTPIRRSWCELEDPRRLLPSR